MRKAILQYVRATAMIAGFSTFMNLAYGQQNIINKKDETHPEIARQQSSAARIYSFSALPMQGYNEIQWSAVAEEDTRKFIVEYSVDGINYQTAGEVTPFNGVYGLKHYTLDERTFLYRIRMEKKDGRYFISSVFLLGGIDARPVKLYPTIVENNTVNLQMYLPVERINVVSLDGKQVMQKNIGGNAAFTQVSIPLLSKGTYLMTFYGNGWQSTEKFMVGG
jgi:hypothetical protein